MDRGVEEVVVLDPIVHVEEIIEDKPIASG